MIKIAFFDVDGTLLKLGSKEPSPKTVQALQQLQANGVLLCMATGRGYLSIPHFEGGQKPAEKKDWRFEFQ